MSKEYKDMDPDEQEQFKKDLLERLRKTVISQEHTDMVRKKEKEMNKEYERIAKAQTVSYEDWHRPFDL